MHKYIVIKIKIIFSIFENFVFNWLPRENIVVKNTNIKKKPLFIGVTGGTASGKTSVCDM